MKRIVAIFRLLNQPCRDMTGLISKAMDARLPFWERVALGLHILYCTACRRYKGGLKGLRDALHHACEDPERLSPTVGPGLSDDARARLKRALRTR